MKIFTMHNERVSNAIYMTVIFIFCIAVAIVFFRSTQFIARTIHKMFAVENVSNVRTFDMQGYSLTARKLNLPPVQPVQTEASTSTTPVVVPEEIE